jgi:hypothetical protein
MKDKLSKKMYEANVQLNTLYDVVDALQSKGRCLYPNDVNECIDNLLKIINEHIYHGHDGYDVIDEKWYSEFTFKKNT